MTTNQQTAAIYESMGIEYLPEGHFHPDNPIGQTFPPIDHNFLALAREKLLVTPDQRYDYYYYLGNEMSESQYSFEATPQQQLTALLKALNLWTE